MKQGELIADPRHVVRRIRAAMQGNAIRALVELITNADDSYVRLFGRGSQNVGTITISYAKNGYDGLFSVRDFAEGMSYAKVTETLTKYGGSTSGSSEGKLVRGYFGQGAKDALAGMEDGRICTFKNGEFTECRLFIKDGKPRYELDDAQKPTPSLRKMHGIPGNGTVAYFRQVSSPQSHVPQFDRVLELVSENYMLRKILMNPLRRVELVSDKAPEPRILRYVPPQGEQLLEEERDLDVSGQGTFRISTTIMRARNELRQTGDDRDGGMLILDEADVVLDISLYRYDNEPLASHLFGEVHVGGFRRLLNAEEPVLRDEREGLNPTHPVCSAIIKTIESQLAKAVKMEQARQQREALSDADPEERRRHQEACRLLNEIAEKEIDDTIQLGRDPGQARIPPPGGIALYPPEAKITVGKRYSFEVVVNSGVVPGGSKISVRSLASHLKIVTPSIHVSDSDSANGMWTKHVTVEGITPGVRDTLECTVEQCTASATVSIEAEIPLLLEEGMVFVPESVTLRPNETRQVRLYMNRHRLPEQSLIRISSDKPTVTVFPDTIRPSGELDLGQVTFEEISLCGARTDEDAVITAQCGNSMALLDVRVRSKMPSPPSGHSGMFSEPDFNNEADPLQPSSYSPELGQVVIYTLFPSVEMYLGPSCVHRAALSAQIRVADLITEKCFQEIARRMAERQGAVYGPEGIPDLVQRNINILSKKYGRRLHELLVDQSLLKRDRAASGQSHGAGRDTQENDSRSLST
ncbi:MAG: hypothetical protein ACYDHF_05895 [Candidatus Cryosericum sp.]